MRQPLIILFVGAVVFSLRGTTADPLTNEVIHKNIDVHIQYALQSLSKGNSDQHSVAHAMLKDVKSGKLDGAYLEDQGEPAKRAQALDTWWGTLIPKGQDAILLMGVKSGQDPIIVLDKEIRKNIPRRDDAVYNMYKLFESWKKGELVKCSGKVIATTSTDNDVRLWKPSKR